MTPVADVGTFNKFVEVIKDLPAWLLTALAVAANVLVFVPFITERLPAAYKPWFVVAAVVFTILAVFKWFNVAVATLHAWRESWKAKKTFHLPPITQHCMWSVAKQADDSMVTQISADFVVKNQTTAPVGLVGVRLIKPTIKGEVLHDSILVREARGQMYGTAYASDHRVPAGAALPARMTMMIRGVPKLATDKPLEVTLGIRDEDGNEQHVKVICKGVALPKAAEKPAALEAPYAIADPIVKEVVSVLQSELSRYDKCGRQAGGLGSVHIVYGDRAMIGMGTDVWTMNSAANQEIAPDPANAKLASDNLVALVGYYGRLTSDDNRARFVAALMDRIDPDKGYLRVTYLIVCTLWQVGKLRDALDQVKAKLPQGEIKEFGMSNTLMMLNGLLRYRYPDFTPEMLDEIERFIYDLTEHRFQIPQKIAAIRARRLAG